VGSDLTYVKVKNKWHYICVFIDLFNREIIGFSTGPNKDTQLALEFGDYVNWFNKLRIHGTRGYVSPLEYKKLFLK
jgi:transposase InsO family protein